MRKLVTVIALVFFFAPTALWVAGVRARPFENRRLAEAPTRSDGWEAFDQTTRFFVDRMPLREQSVRVNTWTSEHVFGTTPDYARDPASDKAAPFAPKPQPATPPVQTDTTVLRGRDGWLFLQDELSRACAGFLPWKDAMRRYERLLSIIRDSGREVVLAVAPDKSTIYPEFLPATFAEKDCYAPGKAKAWAAVEGSDDPDVLGLREPELRGKAAPPEESYYPEDTHWGTKGAIFAARAVLEHLGGEVQLRDEEIRKGRRAVTGDLTGLVGAPEQRESPYWTIERGGATRPGRTVFVHDSFGVLMRRAMRPYFAELSSHLWFGTPDAELIDVIASAQTVILERVERDLNFFASDSGIIKPAFLDQLQARLER